jgi:hypothetical protein
MLHRPGGNDAHDIRHDVARSRKLNPKHHGQNTGEPEQIHRDPGNSASATAQVGHDSAE